MGTSSNPYDAGSPSWDELEREAVNSGKSVQEVAAELGMRAIVTRTKTERDGVTTTVTKLVPLAKAKPAVEAKAKRAVKAKPVSRKRTSGKHQ